MRQNRLMLLIVINHEEPQHQQPGENTADNPATQIKVPKSPGDSSRQEKRCRKNVPPASRREIPRKRSCCQYKFFPGSHASLNYRQSRAKPFACRCRLLLRRGGGHGCRVKTRKPFLWPNENSTHFLGLIRLSLILAGQDRGSWPAFPARGGRTTRNCPLLDNSSSTRILFPRS